MSSVCLYNVESSKKKQQHEINDEILFFFKNVPLNIDLFMFLQT